MNGSRIYIRILYNKIVTQINTTYLWFHKACRNATTLWCPLSIAKSIGRQFLLSRLFGSARNWTRISTVSKKPILAASCNGVVPVCRSAILGSAPCISNNCATGELPIIITCRGVRPKQFTPLTSTPLPNRILTRSVLPVAAAEARSSSRGIVMSRDNTARLVSITVQHFRFLWQVASQCQYPDISRKIIFLWNKPKQSLTLPLSGFIRM